MAGNPKDSKILAYKDMVNQLNNTISAQTLSARVQERCNQQRNLEKLSLLGTDLRPVPELEHRQHHGGQQSFLEQ